MYRKLVAAFVAILLVASTSFAQSQQSNVSMTLDVQGSLTLTDVKVAIDAGVVSTGAGLVTALPNGYADGWEWTIDTQVGNDLFIDTSGLPSEVNGTGLAPVAITYGAEAGEIIDLGAGALFDPNVGLVSYTVINAPFTMHIGRSNITSDPGAINLTVGSVEDGIRTGTGVITVGLN